MIKPIWKKIYVVALPLATTLGAAWLKGWPVIALVAVCALLCAVFLCAVWLSEWMDGEL